MLSFKEHLIEAVRIIKLDPSVAKKLDGLANGKPVRKIQQAEIVALFKKIGEDASINSPIRKRRAGFKIEMFQSQRVMIIHFDDPTLKSPPGTWKDKLPKYEAALKKAGFITATPAAPDFLFVIKVKDD